MRDYRLFLPPTTKGCPQNKRAKIIPGNYALCKARKAPSFLLRITLNYLADKYKFSLTLALNFVKP